MIKHAVQLISQEPGAHPGLGLTGLQTFTYFVAAPVGLFLIISIAVWAVTGTKKVVKPASVITTIE